MTIAKLKTAEDPFAFVKPGLQRWTPAKANKVFHELRYERNRDEKKGDPNIDAFARMMRAGKWREGCAIEFARMPDGKLTLMDGHHRLLGQVRSGLDVTWTVIIHDVANRDEQHELFATYDTVMRKRTMANVLDGVSAAEDMQLSKRMAAALHKAAIYIDNGMKPTLGCYSRQYTPGEYLALAKGWATEAQEYDQCVKEAHKGAKRKLYSAQVTAVALITFRANPSSAWDFWMGLCLDDGLGRDDPRKTLLDWMRDTHLTGSGASSAAAAVARAWAAWRAGRKLTVIRIGKTPVQIAGSHIVVKP